MSEKHIDALTADALAMSEREVFAEAMGLPEPSSTFDPGDRSLEERGSGLEGQREETDEPQPEPEAPATGDQPEAEQRARDRGDDGRFKAPAEDRASKDAPKPAETPAERGLRGEVTAERERRRAAEQSLADYRTETDRRFAALEQQLRATQQPQPKPEPVKEEVPDRFLDPEGYDRWRDDRLHARIQGEMQQQRQQAIRYSLQDAEAQHGDAFREAYRAIDALDPRNPQSKSILDYVSNARDPGAAVMQIYRQAQARREIGADPSAYRQKVEAETRQKLMDDPEFRKSVLDSLNAEARQAGNGAAKPLTSLPPSLSSARGGGASRASIATSERDIFNEAMSSR